MKNQSKNISTVIVEEESKNENEDKSSSLYALQK